MLDSLTADGPVQRFVGFHSLQPPAQGIMANKKSMG